MPVPGLVGRKIGMTQYRRGDGALVAVTAIRAGPCWVTQVRTPAKDGYSAVQLGFEEVGPVPKETAAVKPLNRPAVGHLRRAGVLCRYLREVRARPEELGDVQEGQRVTVAIFQPGDRVDVTGRSKGRGFAGVVKRHHFRGGPKTHGQSDRHRAPGSVGSTTFPGRVLKGQRMAGHMGDQRLTVRNLEVVAVDPERHLLFVQGAVPGPANGLLVIRRAKAPRR